MDILAVLFTLLTCFLHAYFFILETFLWTTDLGLKAFRMSLEKAQSSATLAANQGVYNGLLALGLLATFFMTSDGYAMGIRYYCLLFIIVAGCYGAYSLKSRKVFAIQTIPALIALIANIAARM